MGDGKAADLTVKLGWSDQKKTKKAVDEALSDLAALRGQYSLLFVYCSIKHKLEQVLSAVRDRLGPAPIFGCTTTGEMCSRGVLQNGMVVGGLKSDALDVGVGYGNNVFGDPVSATRRAVSMAMDRLKQGGKDPASRANRVCILHNAGFTLDKPGVEEDVLATVKKELGEGWIIAGGSSGDGARFMKSHQFVDGSVLTESVALCLMATDLNVTHRMEHGFVPTDRSVKITEKAGPVVKRIEGKLALDFYADLLGVAPKKITTGLSLVRVTEKMPRFLVGIGQNVGLTPKLITEKIPFFNYAIENPFGVKNESGAFIVKVPKTITPEGYIEFQTRMDDVDELYLMKIDRDKTVNASSRAAAAVSEGEPPPELVLVFECSGRYMYLLNEIDRVFGKIRNSTKAEIAGFFSSAEQGEMEGVGCQPHNYTTSVIGIGPSK